MSTTQWIILIGGVFFLMTCLALLDIARKEFATLPTKVVWAVVVATLPFIGVVAYFLFGCRKGKRPAAATRSD